jgi:hypothetical protein
MTKTPNAPGTQKVRRATLGSKRAPGWDWQASGRRVRRADVRELKRGADDPSLSGVGGLVDFNAFAQREGLGRQLARDFGHLKTGKQVVYPMHTQIQLLIDAAVVGARRVIDFEWLANDPLFEHLAGGAVPSVDALYDNLRRFGPDEREQLEAMVAEHGLRMLRERSPPDSCAPEVEDRLQEPRLGRWLLRRAHRPMLNWAQYQLYSIWGKGAVCLPTCFCCADPCHA